MPNDAVERKFYLTPTNVEYIEQEKKVRGLPYSYTVNAALDAVRMKMITDRASEMLGRQMKGWIFYRIIKGI